MGLLDKTNPHATRKSVIQWAIFGAVAGPLFLLFIIWNKVPVRFWWIILAAATIFGAGIGALMEWQLDDQPNDEDEN